MHCDFFAMAGPMLGKIFQDLRLWLGLLQTVESRQAELADAQWEGPTPPDALSPWFAVDNFLHVYQVLQGSNLPRISACVQD